MPVIIDPLLQDGDLGLVKPQKWLKSDLRGSSPVKFQCIQAGSGKAAVISGWDLTQRVQRQEQNLW